MFIVLLLNFSWRLHCACALLLFSRRSSRADRRIADGPRSTYGSVMAFNEAILADLRPNFFELLAEEAMHESLRPAVEYVCKVHTHTYTRTHTAVVLRN